MRYKVGMYGGSFDPLHIGHIDVIIKAASQCEILYVVLSYSRERDSIPMEYRYRWIRNCFRHMDNIKIILLEDNAASKSDYNTDYYWEKGRDYVLSQIGTDVDVVFCGDDYTGTNRYENLYKCDVVYFDRTTIPISSSAIKNNPFEYWEYIPKICRPYYTKKVLFVGGESTGKSTLTANLALAYNTNCLEEVGREVCDYAGDENLMISSDFHEILLKHKTKELELIKQSNKLFFVDTDALTTKFFAQFLLDSDKNNVEYLADAITQINTFDLIFFLEPTVAFVQDGTRNVKIEADREKYSQQIKSLFDEAGLEYICLSGDYLNRYEEVKRVIKEKYGI